MNGAEKSSNRRFPLQREVATLVLIAFTTIGAGAQFLPSSRTPQPPPEPLSRGDRQQFHPADKSAAYYHRKLWCDSHPERSAKQDRLCRGG